MRGALNTLEQACDDYDYASIRRFMENLLEGADLSEQLVDLTKSADIVPFKPAGSD